MQGKEHSDSEGSSPLTVTSRVCMYVCMLLSIYFQFSSFIQFKTFFLWFQVLCMLGDITAGPAIMFTQWLQSVRKRTSSHRSSGFPRSSSTLPFWFVSYYFLLVIIFIFLITEVELCLFTEKKITYWKLFLRKPTQNVISFQTFFFIIFSDWFIF